VFLRWVVRELLRNWKFSLFFIFNLSLGLSGYVALEGFKTTLQQKMSQNAKAILSADLAVSARREFTSEEISHIDKIVGTDTLRSHVYEFFAMLNTQRGSRLVLVRAVDRNYPIYGSLEFASKKKVFGSDEKEIFLTPSVWIYSELHSQLGLTAGDAVQLGSLKLNVADVVEKDGTQTFRAASIAPRVFINGELLKQSGLIQYGSTFTLSHFFKIADEGVVEKAKSQLLQSLKDPGIRVDTSKSAGQESGRQLGYLEDYLGLVAIVALFMSSLGAAYIFRLFLVERMREVAILRSLGMQATTAVGIYAVQVAILAVLSLLPTLIVAAVVLPFFSKALSVFIPFDLEPAVSAQAVVLALLVGVVGSLLVCLPFLLKIRDLKPMRLFSEEKFSNEVEISRLWLFLPGVLAFWVLAMTQANSIKIGSIFVIGFFAVLLILFGAGLLLLDLLRFVRVFQSWALKYSLLGVSRRKASSLAIFISLGLGSLLINILPQLTASLESEFKTEATSKIPSLFMFDIQDDQVKPMKDFLLSESISVIGFSPMIRARLLRVNGNDFERKLEEGQVFRTREEETEARFRNRGVNLSYRGQISDSESIVAGRPFSGIYDGNTQKHAELSLENKYADRLGIKIGDIIHFDVQGIEISGQVVNLRKVKWTSFQPNFFVLVQDGVLNEAPKTYITALPKLSEERKNELQRTLAEKFSNVSIVDVQRTVDEVLKVAEQMNWSLELMATLALFAGYVVMYSIVSSQVRLRRWELNMLKIVGAGFGSVTGYIITEFLVIALGAGLMGSVLSILVSYGISYYVFEGSFAWDLSYPLLTALGVCFLSVVVSFLASRRVVRESPLVILQEER